MPATTSSTSPCDQRMPMSRPATVSARLGSATGPTAASLPAAPSISPMPSSVLPASHRTAASQPSSRAPGATESSSASTVASSPPRSAKIARPAAARPFQPGCPLADSSATRGTSWRTSSSSRCHQPTRPRLAIATSSASRSPSARAILAANRSGSGESPGFARVASSPVASRPAVDSRTSGGLSASHRSSSPTVGRTAVAHAARSTPGSMSSSPPSWASVTASS